MMHRIGLYRCLLVGVILVGVVGCKTLGRKAPARPKPAVAADVSGKILAPGRLSQGGKILAVPFTAGENVEQTADLERVALRLVRGVSQGLQGQTKLIMLSDKESEKADFVLKGRIVQRREVKKFPKVFTSGKILTLSVEGELVARRGGETIAFFATRIQDKKGGGDFGRIAEILGKRIGAFIGTAGE